jgi:organic hydroperoxide reductase OsmC/OhrA
LTDTMNAVKAKSMEEPAADHLATIDWQRGEWKAAPGKYSRQHLWVLAGAKLKASDSGALLPAAYRDKVAINPHNMFVATISSAHMLTWLHIAFGMHIEVVSYVDRAFGVLSEVEGGDCWLSEVILHPMIQFDAKQQVSSETIAHIHELAQQHCFIARSIKTTVTVRSA